MSNSIQYITSTVMIVFLPEISSHPAVMVCHTCSTPGSELWMKHMAKWSEADFHLEHSQQPHYLYWQMVLGSYCSPAWKLRAITVTSGPNGSRYDESAGAAVSLWFEWSFVGTKQHPFVSIVTGKVHDPVKAEVGLTDDASVRSAGSRQTRIHIHQNALW